MDEKKKDKIIEKLIEFIQRKNFGIGSSSSRFIVTIDHEKETETYDYSEQNR